MIETKDDLSIPLIADISCTDSMLHDTERVYNEYLLRSREALGKRTKIRVSFEVYTRKNGATPSFSRLRRRSINFSCSSGDQAELVMRTIEQVCRAMDGKHLAPAPK